VDKTRGFESPRYSQRIDAAVSDADCTVKRLRHTRRSQYWQSARRAILETVCLCVCIRAAVSSTLTSVAVTNRHTDRHSDHFSTPAATPRPGATRECSADADCNGEQGETCVRLYDGCRRGQCMCDPTSTGTPPPPPPPTEGDRRRPWDIGRNPSALGYCHHVTRMFDKLDAKCDLC